jgi:predicted ATPase/DNA-binding winged helix-turn-helix (wHTH) protein
MTTPKAQEKEILSFGSFRLDVGERLLTNAGLAVDLSPRAFDILVALTSRHAKVVSKSDLMGQVWPGLAVEEGTLRFHIANLRKALGDGRNGARYITTVSGRGYCFVALVSMSGEKDRSPTIAVSGFRYANLPSRSAMIDREDDLATLLVRLDAERFVTIVGSGGVGKTTLAVAIGHRLTDSFAGAVLFVDLSMLSDPVLVETFVASLLGLSVQSDDAMPSLIAYLRDRRLLLILDTCEHLIEAAAALASTIFASSPQVHILATSRETLQAAGEHVYRLEPLECAPEGEGLTAATARTFPATQLFLERARASGALLEFSDADAAVVVSMCRKLDGVALAIELAARRTEAYGVHQTAALLDQRLTLQWGGSRSAPPRQRTLQATLDWSYGLLSESERLVLRRLAVFVGNFTLDAALAVVVDANLGQTAILRAIDSLVAKSMVAARSVGATMRYRLLDTTRAYALEIDMSSIEVAGLAARHADYFRQWLEQSGRDWSALSTGIERAPYFANINNVRAALEWCFGVDGNTDVGIRLAAAAAPVLLAMSLMPECLRWSEQALLALDDNTRGGPEEMHLQAALGLSLIFTRGESEVARIAVRRGLHIADERGDTVDQVQLLGLLHMFHHRIGDFKAALSYARRSSSVSETIGDPSGIAAAHCILGVTLHHMGDLSDACVELEGARKHGPNSQRTSRIYLGFDHHNWAGGTLARNIWLQGRPDQAVQLAHQTVKEAASMGRPLTLSIALNCAVTVFLWCGNLESAEEHTNWLISHAESHSLATFLAVARGFKGELAIRRGDTEDGVESLQRCLRELDAARYKLLASSFSISLAEGFAATGRLTQGEALVGERIELDQADQALSYVPELLRLKGSLLLSRQQPRTADAELCFARSLELSRRQGARAWQLRTATDLAALYASQAQSGRGRALLEPVLGQFTEGFDTADLKAAERLFATLG